MKKAILCLTAIATMSIISCKKEKCPEPEIITNTVTKTDTVHTTSTVHDTVLVVGMDLIGIWNVYKVEQKVGASSPTFSIVNYKYNFTTTKLLQDIDNNGSYEYNYNVTYGTSYVDIFYTTTPSTHAISTVGTEYRLTFVNGGTTNIFYLKK